MKAGATTLLTSPSNTDTVTANHCWLLRDLILTCRTTGSSGTLMGQGQIYRQDLADHDDSLELLMTTAATINTTASITLDITAQWGTANAANTISCTTVLVESVG